MRRLSGRAIVAAALGVSLAACATNKYQAPSGEAPTMLVVQNQNWLEHVIYLLYGGERIRLGTARSETTTKMTIPPQYVVNGSQLQFLADPIGSRATPVSERVVVSPGDEIQLTIPPSASNPMTLSIHGLRPGVPPW